MRDLDDVLNADREARACAERWLKSVHKGHASGTRPQLARS